MNRASVRELVAGLGVILSLVFVAVQIRANTDAVRGATLLSISEQSINTALTALQTPEARDGLAKVFAGKDMDLTTTEEDAVVLLYTTYMRLTEQRFRQRQLGAFSEVAAVGGLSAVYRVPFFRRFWETRRFEYPGGFAAYVDEVLIPLVRDEPIPRVIPRPAD